MHKIITLFFALIMIGFSLQAQVRAYSEIGFHGQEIVLQPGKYTTEQLKLKGIPSVKSLRIPKGCNVKEYTTSNLQGDATSYSKNKPKIAANQGAQSIKVSCNSSGTPFAMALLMNQANKEI